MNDTNKTYSQTGQLLSSPAINVELLIITLYYTKNIVTLLQCIFIAYFWRIVMPVIRVSDELFSRLEAYAVGFDTPSAVIERLLNEYENKATSKPDNEITKIHDELFQFLLDYKKRYPDFYFMPRQKGDRLENGYWFLGNENYLAISFYTGVDTSNKTPNITFQIYLSDFYLLQNFAIPHSFFFSCYPV